MPTTVFPTPMSDALTAQLPPGVTLSAEVERALDRLRTLEAEVARVREDAAGAEETAALLGQVLLFRMALRKENDQEET